MGAFTLEFQNELARESWALYGLGMLVIGLRFFARTRKLGFRHLDVDDYLMSLAAVFYTLLIITLNLTAQGGGSALAMPGEDVSALSDAQVRVRVKGAKIDLVAEQAMLNVIWVLKVCMLLLYSRLTMGLKQQIAVKIIAAYVGVGWLACQLAYFCECLPFNSYWQISPSPSVNCMVLYDYAIVQGIFNISSDIFMLLIPLPLIMQVSVLLKQKIILLLIFSMGIFVIIAALLTKIHFFTSIYNDDYMFWYTREASVAVYVANLPCIWPLLREALPVLKSWTPGFISSSAYKRRGNSNAFTSGGFTAQGRTARTTQKTNIGVSRHSMDEFQAIVEPPRGALKSGTDVHIREARYTNHTRTGGSSDSSLDNIPIHGILAETTIEMSVMHPDSDQKEDDRDDQSHSSTRAFAYDVEHGMQQPQR